ncbi:DNA replication complex gins protein sld5 [Niveomyces insectorum RCEF 264]|uniref:DNA replication complex GINS protein SLD5 n=1 Tax=Niveomyces insectorum RCEF 264 TaxID=1081102 RepID=A0A167U1Z5_9HYPO|nr:DNA replication complex gins protein sld5 [Niveomyces insectorum RCEF 264]
MDIDDILREVDPGLDPTAGSETSDLQALTRAWVAERSAPELLAWPANGLFERVNQRIKRQIETVEDMTGDMEPKTNFALIVIQTELERYKYLVRSYLRARMTKIDKHTLHYLSSPDLRARLSETELAYATRHQALLHNHYLSSFLASFPPALQNLNDTAGNISMIDSPDLDAAVFVRLLGDGAVRGHGTDADQIVHGRDGDILILRWSDAKPLVEAGDAELFMPPKMTVNDETIALITGANQGIGFETAKKLAAEHKDYRVIMAGRRKDAIDEAAKTLQAQGLAVEPLVLDVTSDASIDAAVAEIDRRYGRLDVLINNAGATFFRALPDGTKLPVREEFARTFDTNVTGVAVVTDACLPLMRRSVRPGRPKRIVFISSSMGSMACKVDPAHHNHRNQSRSYSASKTALNMLAQHYFVDFEGDAANWKINCCCPGYVTTNLTNYHGLAPAASGAINAVRLATLGPDGETGTFSNKDGPVPW